VNPPVTIVGAPTSIGIKPYENGEPRDVDEAPAVLRRAGLARRIDAAYAGEVIAPPYRDFTRRSEQVRNESEIIGYTRELADRIAASISREHFVLVLGGDCSIVLAGLLGLRRGGRRRVGLAYLDAHADFATPAESRTGSAASMCLGLAVGRGETTLAHLDRETPLVDMYDVALIGRRDEGQPWYGHDALHASAVLDVPHAVARRTGYAKVADAALARIARPDLDGFWIHLDADVIDPVVMPAVDSPEPDGPGLGDMAALLRPLAHHPKALGMELTIYDPRLDPDEICANRLVELLGDVFGE
jgi:arginase